MADKEKKTSKSLDLHTLRVIADKLLHPIRAHATFLMTMVALGMLAYSVIMISTIIQQRDDQEYTDKQSVNRIKSTFDKETIQKVDNLRNSTDSSSIDLPAGRRNPFLD